MKKGQQIQRQAPAPEIPVIERQLSSKETHDLGILIRDRAKVLKAHADEQAAACLADFEQKISAKFSFDSDDVWRKAVEEANAVIVKANKEIADRCKKLGIPEEFAPGLSIMWHERGQNAIGHRRTELRKVAMTQIEAMKKAAYTKIERQSLDLRSQVISLGAMSANARMFLESVAPVDEAMKSIDFAELEKKVVSELTKRRGRSTYLGYDPS